MKVINGRFAGSEAEDYGSGWFYVADKGVFLQTSIKDFEFVEDILEIEEGSECSSFYDIEDEYTPDELTAYINFLQDLRGLVTSISLESNRF